MNTNRKSQVWQNYLYSLVYLCFMATAIDPVVRFLDVLGFVDVLLPFVLLFTILYAVFEKTKVLGVEKGHPYHRLNVLVACVLSLFVVGSANLLNVSVLLFQYLGLFAVVILAFAMLLGLFGIEHLPQHKLWNLVFFVVFMFLSVYVFKVFGILGDDSWVVFLFLLFFVVLFWWKVWKSKNAVVQQPASPATGHHKPGSGMVTPKAGRPKIVSGLGPEEEIKLGEEE